MGSPARGGGGRRRRSRMAPDATINLTSLLDIVFNLLLIFMLLAPALKHGLTVELARTGGGSRVLNVNEPLTIVISQDEMDPEPRIYIDNERVMIDQIQGRLQSRVDAEPGLTVLIEPARTVPTETTLQVLAAVLGAGVEHYGFVTEPAGTPGAAPAATEAAPGA